MYREHFDIPTPGLFTASYLAEVVAVDDPSNLARVQVRLLAFDGIDGQDGPIWARVAAPFAGPDRGTFFLPDVGDEVVVIFVNGDARLPIVVGSLWNGSAAPPETLGGDRVDRWSMVGKAGTRIAIVEESAASATVAFSTPGGVSGTLSDRGGGRIELRAAGSTIVVDASGVRIQTGAMVKVEAGLIDVSAGLITVDAGMSMFSGIVQCDTLITNTVLAATYSPGAGNVW
jgi:uncharacterized protein involved in type VI secretion and phage assembly